VPGGTTARTLAPSEEAFDAPLSPPPLGDKPGPATGRSGDYPGGTCTRWSGPVFRTQHVVILGTEISEGLDVIAIPALPLAETTWSCHGVSWPNSLEDR
jgi:hypothetical protein